MQAGTDPDPTTSERRAILRVLLGVGLIFVPMGLYPGNWTTTYSTALDSRWEILAVAVFVSLAVGAAIVVASVRDLMHAWSTHGTTTARGALARNLLDPRHRRALYLSAAFYAIFFAFVASLYSLDLSGPGIAAASYPSATNVLCCGYVGITPAAVLVVTPSFELVIYPLVLVILFAATLLFALNVTLTVALFRSRASRASSAGSGALGGVAALLVNCPACGTLLLWNVVAGTSAAAFLTGFVTYYYPLLALAFPLAVFVLIWTARRLARAAGSGEACPRPARPMTDGS